MKGKRNVMRLGFISMLALALSISSFLIAGDRDEPDNSPMGTFLTTDSNGVRSIATISPTSPNGRSWNITINFVNFDYRFNYPAYPPYFPTSPWIPNAAPMQAPAHGQGFMTGPDTYQNSFIFYCKNNDGSLAYVMVAKGKGRILDANHSVSNLKTYWYFWGFVDANNDGIPDDDTGAFVSDVVATDQRLSAVIPPLEGPDEYPAKPRHHFK
jgi:hypothetical protein